MMANFSIVGNIENNLNNSNYTKLPPTFKWILCSKTAKCNANNWPQIEQQTFHLIELF